MTSTAQVRASRTPASRTMHFREVSVVLPFLSVRRAQPLMRGIYPGQALSCRPRSLAGSLARLLACTLAGSHARCWLAFLLARSLAAVEGAAAARRATAEGGTVVAPPPSVTPLSAPPHPRASLPRALAETLASGMSTLVTTLANGASALAEALADGCTVAGAALDVRPEWWVALNVSGEVEGRGGEGA